MSKRYCGMCEEMVKGRECPKCGFDTDAWPKGEPAPKPKPAPARASGLLTCGVCGHRGEDGTTYRHDCYWVFRQRGATP